MVDLIKLDKNIIERAKLLNEAEDDVYMQETLKELCSRDPIYFFEYFVFTDRNTSLFPWKYWVAIPFLLFEFQKDYIRDAWNAILMWQLPLDQRTEPTDLFSEKSRQMWFSWLYAWLQLYAFIFHNLKSLYISMKADEVDKSWDIKSHFEKIRFIIRNLPSWMLPEWLSKDSWTEHNKFMVISRADWTWSIKWESANPNAWRWWTTAFTIFDEMAFMQYAQAINMSIGSSTPCRFFNSTPNWEWNEYFRMRKLALDWKIRYHRCHWSEHPHYTLEWYKWRIQGMSKEQIAQELEIDYNVALKGRVYPDFEKWTYNNEYNEHKPLYLAIDNSHWWADPHALILMQPEWHYWNIIETCEFSCSVTDMAKVISKQPSIVMTNKQLEFYEKYKNMKTPIFISDPYDTHSTLNQSTIFEEYQKVWIFLNVPQNRSKKEQIMKTKANIKRYRTNENCVDFISAIQNARYPDIPETSNRTKWAELPIHDWTSHYRTALEYLTTYILENAELIDKPQERIAYEYKNPITWEIETRYQYI